MRWAVVFLLLISPTRSVSVTIRALGAARAKRH
jgi:hypothetical protein